MRVTSASSKSRHLQDSYKQLRYLEDFGIPQESARWKRSNFTRNEGRICQKFLSDVLGLWGKHRKKAPLSTGAPQGAVPDERRALKAGTTLIRTTGRAPRSDRDSDRDRGATRTESKTIDVTHRKSGLPDLRYLKLANSGR